MSDDPLPPILRLKHPDAPSVFEPRGLLREARRQKGLGERLFDSEGEQTQYLGGVLEFLKAYQVQFQRTEALCRKLNELELQEGYVSISTRDR